MGVYIANMEMPKECKDCQWHLDFYIEDEQVGGLCTITEKDDKENICPLIEIVRCGECKHCIIRETKANNLANYCEAHGITVLKTDYCNWGERRADDNTIKADK